MTGEKLGAGLFDADRAVDEFVLKEARDDSFAPLNIPTAHASADVDYGPMYIGPPPGAGKPGGGDPGNGGGGNVLQGTYVSGPIDAGFDDTITVDTYRADEPFNIEVRYYGDAGAWDATDPLIATIQSYVEAAAEFLSAILGQGNIDDDDGITSFGDTFVLDDLLIEVRLTSDGPGGIVASTSIFGANDWDGDGIPETPAGATLTIDLTDAATLDGLGVLDDTVLHEMIHALGFGGLWENGGNDLTSKSKGSTVYTGEAANAYYDGTGSIEVEGGGRKGTGSLHWSEATYDNELMTGVVEDTDTMYLAEWSVAALQDLGYTLADDWQQTLADLNGTSDLGGIDLLAWLASTQDPLLVG